MSILNKNVSRIEPKHIQDNFLPPETLSDKASQQRRLEHRKQGPFKLAKCARRGIEQVINFDYAPNLNSSAAWTSARTKYNAGAAAAALGLEAARPDQWSNLETAYLTHKSPHRAPHGGESLIVLEPKIAPPQKNAFMQARVSVYPLLSVLNFKSISPLMSILWSDTKSCSLYDFYHFVRWYAQLRDSPGPGGSGGKRYIGDKRERLDRRKLGTVFQGAGLTALDACISNVLGQPITDAGRKQLEAVLGQLPQDDAKYEFLRNLLGGEHAAEAAHGSSDD